MAGELEVNQNAINETIYRTDTSLKGTDTSLLKEMVLAGQERTADGIDPNERIFDRRKALSLMSIVARQTKQYNDDTLTQEELSEKRRLMLDTILDFEVLHFSKSADEQRQDKELVTRRREEKAERMEIPRTLFSSSNEQKLRVLKTLKLDEMTRKNLMKEEKGLEEILHTYVTKEEQSKAAKEGKKFLKIFRKTKEELNKNPLLTAGEKAARLYRLAKPYETAVVMYKEEYFTTLEESGRQREIEMLLDRITRFYDLYSGNIEDRMEEWTQLREEMEITDIAEEKQDVLSRVRQRARKIDKSEAEGVDTTLDDTLSADQIAGIEAVDRYIIEKSNTSGGNKAFVDRILKLSLRDRLLMYGLIENRREAAPSAADIAYTQVGYVPNADIFANRMSHIPGFMWAGRKKQMFSRFVTDMRWEKLEAAAEYLSQADVKLVRDSFARLSGANTGAVQDAREMAVEELEEPSVQMVRLTETEIKRDRQLLKTITALENCKAAIVESEKTIFHRKSKKTRADEMKDAARAEVEKLENYDRELYNIVSDIREHAEMLQADEKLQPDWRTKEGIDQKISTKEPGESTAKKVIRASVFTTSQGSLLLSKTNQVVTLCAGDSPAAVNMTSAVFTSLTGVVGLIGGLMGAAGMIAAIKKNGSSMARTDIANMVTKSMRSLGASGWGVAAGGFQAGLVIAGKIAANKVTEGAVEAAKTMKENIGFVTNGVTYATAAVSGIKALVDLGDAGVQVKHAVHYGAAAYRVYKLEKKKVLKGDEAVYANNILKIDLRNKKRNAVETANSFMVNAAGIAATVWGGPVGAVAYAGASVLNTIIMKSYMKVQKKIDISAMVDDFLQLDSVTARAFPEYSTFDIAKKMRARARIKEEMMAELGYTSSAAFSKHIAKNYAQFIYDKLFFKDGDKEKPLLEKDNKEKTLTDESKACYQMVKSLGLRVVYPEDEAGDRYPAPEMIAKKLLAG